MVGEGDRHTRVRGPRSRRKWEEGLITERDMRSLKRCCSLNKESISMKGSNFVVERERGETRVFGCWRRVGGVDVVEW